MSLSCSIGELIIFKKKNRPVLGIVSSLAENSLVVLTEDGKEKDIDINDLDYTSSIITDTDKNNSEKKLILREFRRVLNQSRETVDLESLWDSLTGSVEKLPFSDILEIYTDDKQVSDEERLKFYWALNKTDIYFTNDNGNYYPSDESDVKARLVQKEQEKKKTEETEMAVEWAKNILSGKMDDNKLEFDKDYYVRLIKDFIVNKSPQDKIREAKAFLNQVGINKGEDATGFLIKLGICSEYADPNLLKLEFLEKSSPKTEKELEQIINDDTEPDDCIDLTSENIITIDDEDTEDIDDAISLNKDGNNLQLGIHISNVAHYIRKGSTIDQDALSKGDTVYIPDKRIDIFPKDLLKEKFSLFEGMDKLAVSLIVTLDRKTFDIKDFKFVQSKINVRKNYSYIEAEKTLLKEKTGKDLVNIALSLRQKRIQRGAFLLQLPELKFSIDEKGKIQKKINRMNSIPHMIIAELMILTNNLTAKFLNEHKLPSIFRVQNEEIPREAREFDINDPLFSVKVVKHLRPSVISTNTGRHRSLGLDSYVQSTSPIRRYSDLVVQRQIVGILTKDEWIYDGKELFDIIGKIINGFGERRLLQKNRRKYWLYRYLGENIKEDIKGIVTSVNGTNVNAYLPDYFIEVTIKNYVSGELKEYDDITLNIEEVDPLRKRLNLKIIGVN